MVAFFGKLNLRFLSTILRGCVVYLDFKILILMILCTAVAFFLGIIFRKLKAEKLISSAEKEAEKIIINAQELAETRKKEVVLEGKEEIHKFRNESEKELFERRKDLQRQERRVMQKEENLDKKIEKFGNS